MQGKTMISQDAASPDIECRLRGRKLHVLRCLRGKEVIDEDGKVWMERGGITVPQKSADASAFFEILSVGEKCIYYSDKDVGGFILLPAGAKEYIFCCGEKEFIVKEQMYEEMKNPPPLCVFEVD